MSAEIITAILAFAGTLIGTFSGILTSTKLSNYRIEQLEKKVEKHNGVIERQYKSEEDIDHIFHEIDEMKTDIRSLRT